MYTFSGCAVYILQSNTRAKNDTFCWISFFFCASRRTLRKLQHYRPKFTQPGLPIVTPCVSAFSSMFESQKASFRAESLSLSLSLSLSPLPSLSFPLSYFILSTRVGLKLFCFLARGHLNGAPASLKRPCLNPSSGDANEGRGKTCSSHAQFYRKPSRGLPRRWKGPREKEQEDAKELQGNGKWPWWSSLRWRKRARKGRRKVYIYEKKGIRVGRKE